MDRWAIRFVEENSSIFKYQRLFRSKIFNFIEVLKVCSKWRSPRVTVAWRWTKWTFSPQELFHSLVLLCLSGLTICVGDVFDDRAFDHHSMASHGRRSSQGTQPLVEFPPTLPRRGSVLLFSCNRTFLHELSWSFVWCLNYALCVGAMMISDQCTKQDRLPIGMIKGELDGVVTRNPLSLIAGISIDLFVEDLFLECSMHYPYSTFYWVWCVNAIWLPLDHTFTDFLREYEFRRDDDMSRLEDEFRDSLLMPMPNGNMHERDHRTEQVCRSLLKLLLECIYQ